MLYTRLLRWLILVCLILGFVACQTTSNPTPDPQNPAPNEPTNPTEPSNPTGPSNPDLSVEPPARFGHSLIKVGDKIFLLGGGDEVPSSLRTQDAFFDDLWEFSNDDWEEVVEESIPNNISKGDVVFAGSKVYGTLGSPTTDNPNFRFYEFDPVTDIFSFIDLFDDVTPLPASASQTLAPSSTTDSFFIFGGESQDSEYLNKLFGAVVIDGKISLNQSKSEDEMLSSLKAFFGQISISGQSLNIILGGSLAGLDKAIAFSDDLSNALGEKAFLTADTKEWKHIPQENNQAMSFPRVSRGAVVSHENKMYIFGGVDNDKDEAISSVTEIIFNDPNDLSNVSFRSLEPLPEARIFSEASIISADEKEIKVLIFGGKNAKQEAIAESLIYTIPLTPETTEETGEKLTITPRGGSIDFNGGTKDLNALFFSNIEGELGKFVDPTWEVSNGKITIDEAGVIRSTQTETGAVTISATFTSPNTGKQLKDSTEIQVLDNTIEGISKRVQEDILGFDRSLDGGCVGLSSEGGNFSKSCDALQTIGQSINRAIFEIVLILSGGPGLMGWSLADFVENPLLQNSELATQQSSPQRVLKFVAEGSAGEVAIGTAINTLTGDTRAMNLLKSGAAASDLSFDLKLLQNDSAGSMTLFLQDNKGDFADLTLPFNATTTSLSFKLSDFESRVAAATVDLTKITKVGLEVRIEHTETATKTLIIAPPTGPKGLLIEDL